MRRFLRNHLPLIFGVALVITGTGLLVVGIPFVTGWLSYLSLASEPLKPPTGCGSTSSATCQIITIYLLSPPSPYPTLISYAAAIPTVLGIGWWGRRHIRDTPDGVGGIPHSLRHASVLLIGTMGWMGLFIATGFAMDWLSLPVFPWIRYLFLVSLLVVPSLVVVVGATFLGLDAWRQIRRRSPAARG